MSSVPRQIGPYPIEAEIGRNEKGRIAPRTCVLGALALAIGGSVACAPTVEKASIEDTSLKSALDGQTKGATEYRVDRRRFQ